MTFFYQNIKKSARVSSPGATTFEGILACGSMVLSVYVYRYFARQGEITIYKLRNSWFA